MKKRILSMILALVLVVGIMPTATFASIGEDEKHLCDAPGSYCLVCEVAEKINALPAKDDIDVNNAAAVIEDIHAIDRIKFDLTDEQYEELLTLVENENYAPARYFDAIDAIKEIEKDYSSFVAVKSFSSESGNVDVSNASVKFKVTNTETGLSQTLTMSTMPYQLGSLSADADFYSANSDGSGWSYKYILPAGNYKIEEIDDSGATVDGEHFVTGSTFCSVDGSEETEGKIAAFTVEDGGNTVVTFDNSYGPGESPTYYTVTFYPGEGSGYMEPTTVGYGEEFILPECEFTAPADAEFVAWEVDSGEYKAGDSIYITGDTTVTAVWKKYYNITFNSNGGTGEMDSKRILEGVDFVLPECEFTAPAGTEFKAWGIDDVEYSPGETFYLPEDAEESSYDIEVKALWDNYYTVTFDANNGGGTMKSAKAYARDNYWYMLPECGFTPPEGGYRFKCWKVEGDNEEYYNGNEIQIDGNVTVKAIWEKFHTITFIHSGDVFKEVDCIAGSKATFTTGMELPTTNIPEGHTFLGWCTTDNIWVNSLLVVDKNLTAYSVYHTEAKITGDSDVGKTLTAEVTVTPTKEDIPMALSYQWKRNGSAISGATEATYVPTEADANCTLICEIKAGGAPRPITTKSVVVKASVFPVTVENGTADKAEAKEGETVTITANSPATGKIFSEWTSGDVTFENASAEETTFVMPAKEVTVTANYSDCDHENNTNIDDGDCTTEVKCSVCKETIVAAKSHNYSGATYEWSTDGKSCVAKRSCQNDGCKASETATATITSAEKTSATCSEVGTTTYTATFNADWTTTQTKDVQDIQIVPHDWNETTYEWSADGKSCVATRTCKNYEKCNGSETATATITSAEKTSATCTEMGTTTYTATFTADWATEQTKDVQDIPATEHDWSVEYEWSADGKSCKAIRVCGNDAKHNISEEATVTSAEKTPATCTEMGTTTYTATFTADWATEQTKDVQDIPAIKHDWNDTTYEWSTDGKSCKAIRVCGNNEEHVETAIATVKGKVVKKATCIEKGNTLYTATFNVDWAAEQTKTITDIEIDADNHNVVIDKASDPTCTETGLTEGKHCSDCKKILVEQQTIKALGHDYGRWVKIYEPTETEPGVKVKTCHNCGKKIYADIAPLSKDGIEELGPGAGKPETGTETNPNTGAPALVPFAAAFAILSGTVVFKKKK